VRTADGMYLVAPIASEQCPGCQRGWVLFPPAQIHGQQTMHRCISCKRVYEFVAREVENDGRA
jgi:hypothetical protein